MSHDTGTAMTLIGYRGFTRRPSHCRNRPVRGTAGTHDETDPDAEHTPHCLPVILFRDCGRADCEAAALRVRVLFLLARTRCDMPFVG